MMTHSPQRGFTLLVSVILASVALSIGLALLDIAYKQVVLASSARQSQNAFYNADAVLECALYWDQTQNSFRYTDTSSSISITCGGQPITVTFTNPPSGTRTRTFTMPCSGGGTSGSATITKQSDATTNIFASGYNTCDDSHTRRIERGLKVIY